MTIRIGIIGPAHGKDTDLADALSRLLDDPDTRQIIYLGLDGAAAATVTNWQSGSLTQAAFLERAAQLASRGTPDAIDALLAEEDRRQRLAIVRCLPPPPARAVEMLERWMILAVHDKAILDKDDIANAQVILYGKSKGADFKRFGPRCFFTPGPLSAGLVGRLELAENGDLTMQACDRAGQVRIEENLRAGAAKLVVST